MLKQTASFLLALIMIVALCACGVEPPEKPCVHNYENGKCTLCGQEEPQEEPCTHNYQNGKCTLCGEDKPMEEKTLLFVGNSYTYYNNHMLAAELKKLAAEAAFDITIVELSHGSAYLDDYLTGAYADELNTALSTHTYDYVVLQEQSTFPVLDKQGFVSSVEAFITKLTAIQPDAEIVLYSTWARKAGHAWLASHDMTVTEMQQALDDGYAEAAQEIEATLSPVGKAFTLILQEGGIELYNSDGTHPSPEGSFLAALVHFAAIFDESPTLSQYVPQGISQADATKLKEAARKAVFEHTTQGD